MVPATPMWYFGSFLVVIGGITASFFAVSASSSMVVVFNGIFVLLVWQWTTRSVLTDVHKVQKAITAFVLGTTLSSVVAILQTKLHILGYRGSTGGSEGARALGLTTQPNIAAVTFGLGLTFAIGLVLHLGVGRRWYRIICIAGDRRRHHPQRQRLGHGDGTGRRLRPARQARHEAAHHHRHGILLVGIYAVATALEGNGNGGENLNPFARVQQTTGSGTGYNTVSPREET